MSLDEKEQKSVYFSATIFKASKKLKIDNQNKGVDDRFEMYQGRKKCGYMWEMT